MKKVMIVILISIVLQINLSLDSLELTDMRMLSESESEIVKVFEDQETGKVVRVYSSFDENNIFHQGLLFENGDRLPFEVNERVIEISDNKILVKKQLNRADEEVTIYEYNQEKIKKTKSMKIGLYNPFHMLKNGNFFYSDYAEGFAWTFSLYSSNLDLICTYKPFESGFESYSFEDFGDSLFVGVAKTLNDNNGINFYHIDTVSGELKIKTETTYSIDYVNHIKYVNNNYLISAFRKLIAINLNGETVWERDITANKYYLSETSIDEKLQFIYSKDKIMCISLIDGSTVWQEYFSQYFEKNTESKINPVSVPITIIDDKQVIVFILGNQKQNIFDKFLLINLDFEGNLLTKKELIKDTNVFTIIEDHDSIKLLTDKEVLHYEK